MSLPGELRRVTATAWVRGRVLAIVSGSTSTTVYSVDPNEQAVISQIEFPGTVSVGERTASSVVLLLTSARRDRPGYRWRSSTRGRVCERCSSTESTRA